MMLYTPRTLFALADDGFLPRPLAAVHAEYHTPHVAIAIQAVVVCVIAVTGTYVRLALMADVARLIVYLACCVGEGRLRQLNGRSEGEPFLMPAGRVVPPKRTARQGHNRFGGRLRRGRRRGVGPRVVDDGRVVHGDV